MTTEHLGYLLFYFGGLYGCFILFYALIRAIAKRKGHTTWIL